MLKSALGLAAIALVLSACSPGDAELDGDLVVNGTDPAAWTAQISPEAKSVAISVLGAKDIKGALPVKSKGEKGEVVLTSATPEGDFAIHILPGKCEDGLTDKEYHWSASVAWKGETLKGCAGPGKLTDAGDGS